MSLHIARVKESLSRSQRSAINLEDRAGQMLREDVNERFRLAEKQLRAFYIRRLQEWMPTTSEQMSRVPEINVIM